VFEKEKEAGEGMWAGVCVMQKASSKIAISLGGACEEQKKNHMQNAAFVFLGCILYYLRWMFWLRSGRIVCVCVHTQREIRRAHYVVAQGPCLAMLPACTRRWILQLLHHSRLSQTYPADSRLHNALPLF